MPHSDRFRDEKYTIADFYDEVWVACPACAKKATAHADREKNVAKLYCKNCGYNKQVPTIIPESINKKRDRIAPHSVIVSAHTYFDAQLWMQLPFKNDIFWAYNEKHLNYLEKYIAAHLRESIDRTGYTMVEKLPKFIQSASNREPLLKLIEKLRKL